MNEKPRHGAGASADELGSRNLPSQLWMCNPRARRGLDIDVERVERVKLIVVPLKPSFYINKSLVALIR